MSRSAIIIGAGFSGVAAAIELRDAGVQDIVILERGSRVGGVWNANTYPGAACDVPSHVYSYSFARNPRWGRRFAPQPEIQRYVEDVARRFGVLGFVRCDIDAQRATWDEGARRWAVETSDGTYEADLLIAACGQLSRPAIPDLPGLDEFAGPAFHSAKWRHDLDLTGLRVGVLGTGASAIQFVPAIQPLVRELTVFQRTPPWIIPKFDKAYRPLAHRVFGAVPPAQLAGRFGWWAFLEANIAGFIGHPRALGPLQATAKAHLRRQVPDPVLREKLTPTYRIGCKRILLSNDWYPTLGRPNVDVVTDRIARVTRDGVELADGEHRELDAIVFGTGFEARQFVAPLEVAGRGGVTLEETWAGMPTAWHGLTLPEFPNLFLMYGPNTYGGSGSAIYMIESQARHVGAAARALKDRGAGVIELRKDAYEAFVADLRTRQSRTIWATGGCRSWYLDDQGRDPTNWPGYTVDYRRRTARVDDRAYAIG